MLPTINNKFLKVLVVYNWPVTSLEVNLKVQVLNLKLQTAYLLFQVSKLLFQDINLEIF